MLNTTKMEFFEPISFQNDQKIWQISAVKI